MIDGETATTTTTTAAAALRFCVFVLGDQANLGYFQKGSVYSHLHKCR